MSLKSIWSSGFFRFSSFLASFKAIIWSLVSFFISSFIIPLFSKLFFKRGLANGENTSESSNLNSYQIFKHNVIIGLLFLLLLMQGLMYWHFSTVTSTLISAISRSQDLAFTQSSKQLERATLELIENTKIQQQQLTKIRDSIQKLPNELQKTNNDLKDVLLNNIQNSLQDILQNFLQKDLQDNLQNSLHFKDQQFKKPDQLSTFQLDMQNLSSQMASLQSSVRLLNQKMLAQKILNQHQSSQVWLPQSALPFKVLGVDIWSGIPGVTVQMSEQTDLLLLHESRLGWQLIHIDWDTSEVIFQNTQHKKVKIKVV